MKKKLARLNIDKFSFAQLVSNNSGKTSGSGAMGVLICTVGCLGFLVSVGFAIFKSEAVNLANESLTAIGIGAALLGYRKSKIEDDQAPIVNVSDHPEEQPVTPDEPVV